MAAVMITPSNAARPADATRLVLVERAHAIRTSRPSVATYRRRRLATVLLGLAMVVMAGRAAAGAVGGASPAPAHRPPSTVTHVVRPGDSLWSIAAEVAPDRDPRDVVDALQSTRQGAALIPGEQIVWPTR